MVVTSLGGVASFSVGLGVKTHVKNWFGLVQDLMGQKFERYYHIWLACSLMVLLSIGCLQLCCMDRKFALIPKLM